MDTIRDLKPECIWRNFDELTKVPRPSGHLEKVQQFLLDFGKNAGVEAFKDAGENIVMRKAATPGYENRKMVTLQAHMDMVPQKTPESTHNFLTDPIETYIEDGWVKARGTTLGADDGIGVAAIMAVMEDKTLKHGPIEAIITADEETTMYGANHLPEGELQGDLMLNLDSELWGKFVIGAAGGISINATLGYKEVDTDTTDAAVRVTLKGLRGGHSGLEINEGRANAHKLMVRFVREAIETCEARLASWQGGDMPNAIPFKATVVLTVPKENVDALKGLVDDCRDDFADEYKGIESGIEFYAEDVPTPQRQVPEEIQDNLVDAIYACHDGILRMIPSFPSIVETSSNLAIISIADGQAEIKVLARSSREDMKGCIVEMLASCFGMAGMKVETSGDYIGWDPNVDSEFLHLLLRLYREQEGTDAIARADHAGLECSVFLSKYPDMDIVSMGTTLLSPHTTNERVEIACVDRFWRLLRTTLENIPEK